MNDCCARVVLLLASLVLGFVAWFPALAAGKDYRTASIAGTVTSLILAIAVWRKYVRWTVLRSSSSLGVVLLVLAQVLLWRPLWGIVGCGRNEELRTAQSLATLGLGLIALVLLWWGQLLSGHPRSFPDGLLRRLRMTPNAVRLTVAIALVPFLPGVFFIGAYALRDFGPSWSDEIVACLCYEACAAIAVTVWWRLWRQAVEWNHRRRVATWALTAVLLASPAVVLAARWPVFSPWGDVWMLTCWLAPVLAGALWLAGTAWVWRSSGPPRELAFAGGAAAAEALARCPRCDYSLKGLHEVHCPECGWAATVDELAGHMLAALAGGP
jgi:hypothetical protein